MEQDSKYLKKGSVFLIKVLDVASTDQGAYRLLRTRVNKINNNPNFENIIACPSGVWQKK